VNQAYQILTDPEVKRRYDNTVGNLLAAETKTKDVETIFSDQPEYKDLDAELEKLEMIKKAR
jgi:DnaJ-class molecular chaperone